MAQQDRTFIIPPCWKVSSQGHHRLVMLGYARESGRRGLPPTLPAGAICRVGFAPTGKRRLLTALAKNRHSRLQPPNAMRFHPNRSLGETSRTAKGRLGHHIPFALAALDGALRKVVVPRGLFVLVSWTNDPDDAGGRTIAHKLDVSRPLFNFRDFVRFQMAKDGIDKPAISVDRFTGRRSLRIRSE